MLSSDLLGFLNQVSATLIMRVTGAGLAFITQILLARWMGIGEFGVYAYAWTLALMLGSISQLGLGTSSTRFVTDYLHRKRTARVSAFISFTICCVALAGLVLTLAGLGITAYVYTGAGSPYYLPTAIALLMVPVMGLHIVGRGVNRGFGHILQAYIPGFLARPAIFLGLVAALYYAAQTITASLTMMCMLAVVAAVTLYQWIRIVRSPPAGPPNTRTKWHWRHWLAVSLPVLLVEGQYLLLSNLDIIMLKHWVAPNEIAKYFAAARTIAPLTFIYFAVSAVASHQLAKAHSAGDRDQLTGNMRRYITCTFWPTVAGLFVIMVIGQFLLDLYGKGFREGYSLFPILAVGILFQAATGPLRHLLMMTGNQNALAQTLTASTLLNIVLNVLLIPHWGIAGAAIATSASLSAACLSMAAVAYRRLGIVPIIGMMK
jgi:O-antigen/teichoic acid export membrane protein